MISLDNRWSGYAAAAGGDENARMQLIRTVEGPEIAGVKRPRCSKALAEYRLLLYGAGEERAGGEMAFVDTGTRAEYPRQDAARTRRGFRREKIKACGRAEASCPWRRP